MNRGEAGGNGRFHRWEADFQEMPDLMELGTGSQAEEETRLRLALVTWRWTCFAAAFDGVLRSLAGRTFAWDGVVVFMVGRVFTNALPAGLCLLIKPCWPPFSSIDWCPLEGFSGDAKVKSLSMPQAVREIDSNNNIRLRSIKLKSEGASGVSFENFERM